MKQLPESETFLPVRVSLAFGPLQDHLHAQAVAQRTQPPGDLDIHLQRGPLSGYGSSVRLGSGPTAEIAQKRAECLLHSCDLTLALESASAIANDVVAVANVEPEALQTEEFKAEFGVALKYFNSNLSTSRRLIGEVVPAEADDTDTPDSSPVAEVTLG